MMKNQDHETVVVREMKSSDPVNRPSPRLAVLKAAVVVTVLLVNVAALSMAILSLQRKEGEQRCQTSSKVRAVVAALCVPCEDSGIKARDNGEEEEEEEGWRRYTDDQQDLCCPLDHHSLAVAVGQIYHTVLQEQQQDSRNIPEMTYRMYRSEYQPDNTADTVQFANNHKPCAHVTGVQPYNASMYPLAEVNGSGDVSLQTVNDWPLRFELYRSISRGYVQRLTWGLMVPVSGLYRVYSNVNLYFTSGLLDSKHPLQQKQAGLPVVHQVTRYSRSEGISTVLTQRNQTVSRLHADGLTSFVVTVQELEVGDVVSVTLSHHAAMAMRDRWHSQGLFLLM